jgi:hypothetical protein
LSNQEGGSGGCGVMRSAQQKRLRSVVFADETHILTILQFIFDDIEKNGRAPIQVTPLETNRIQQTAQRTIDEAPSHVEYEYETACRGPPYHLDECLIAQDHGMSCIQDRLSEANTRLRGCRSKHWLKECLQKPERAHARRFLEHGLLQESFVYRKEDVSTTSIKE